MSSKSCILFPSVGLTIVPEDPIVFDERKDEDPYYCSECATSKYIDLVKNEYICTECSTSFGYLIDMGPETRWFGSEDRSPDPTRVGGPTDPHLPESSTATRMVWRPNECKSMRRIRRFHVYSAMPSRERTLWNVFETLNIRVTNAGISLAILNESEELYFQIYNRCRQRKPQQAALLAACTFESLKRHGSARHPKDVADIFCVDISAFSRALKQLNDLLEEYSHEQKEVVHEEYPLTTSTTSTTFSDYIEAALIRLTIPRTLLSVMQEKAIDIGKKVNEYGICPETTPPSLAATSIALACEAIEYPKPMTAIAAALDISVATLSKCMKRCTNKDLKMILFSKGL
jgi:transcription initiation factor TFIIIB Brf1 subunit/transcription initiation factor TFIIB